MIDPAEDRINYLPNCGRLYFFSIYSPPLSFLFSHSPFLVLPFFPPDSFTLVCLLVLSFPVIHSFHRQHKKRNVIPTKIPIFIKTPRICSFSLSTFHPFIFYFHFLSFLMFGLPVYQVPFLSRLCRQRLVVHIFTCKREERQECLLNLLLFPAKYSTSHGLLIHPVFIKLWLWNLE